MAKDPYKYYRVEAAELLDNLTRGVLELEKGPDREMVTSLLRLAHTLKGASQVVKQPGIAQAAHSVEDILGPYRDQDATVPKEQTSSVMRLLDQIGAQLGALDAPGRVAAGAVEGPRTAEPGETVRVEVEEMDELLGSLAEASIDLHGIQSHAESLQRARQLAAWIVQQLHSSGGSIGHGGSRIRAIADELLSTLVLSERRIAAGVEHVEREIGQARDRASRLRLLPSQTIFPSLARATREAGAALGKKVVFAGSGGEVRLDAQVLTVLRDALLHLVRNAVAHGIEAEPERLAAGKPAAGRIAIDIRRVGSRITFQCTDDGRGMDLAAIRRAAVEKGAISEASAERLGLQQAIELILKGGLSTSAVTRISGRGIGLDVVRDAVERLKGRIRIETASGQGTTVEMCVPVSLTAVTALVMESSGITAAIPLEAVRETLRVGAGEIAEAGAGESIAYRGRGIPFLRLSDVLRRTRPGFDGKENRTAVIVGSGPDLAAVGVERLGGTGVMLVRPLPKLAGAEPVLAGAALDAEGTPIPVLDPELLVHAVERNRDREAPAAGKPRLPILLIDDSLTTRMVEQSVLESAGHCVESAASGEEALEKAHQRKYSLFLVDVEMPGMDGFEFISRAQRDPLLREIPTVLVTSRGSAADRRHGEEVGARAYITKSEFDQSQFLETIRRLVA